jgi:2-dehydro-3-deoxyphosphooctonate aldolase (KDO 8-P synthase)
MSIGFEIADGIRIGDGELPLVISGPCVIESEALCFEIAERMIEITSALGLSYVFKASFDKANRTSASSYRGLGVNDGLKVLAAVKDRFKIPVTTDIHEVAQVDAVAEVVDILQIPAFLCRQTDLLQESGRSGRVVNIKKGQFMAPGDMAKAVEKVKETGNDRVALTERGTTFGYHNLVVDMRGLIIMRELGVPVIMDATHSVQIPAGQGDTSGGNREYVPHMVRAASAVGVDGYFLETHPDPEKAMSDGPNNVYLDDMQRILSQGKAIHELIRQG